jgi:ABC-type sulfate/molybdate transport systems ATPase subunit
VALRLRPSRDLKPGDGPEAESHPFVSVEEVERIYEPVRARRIHRLLSVFGGLGADLYATPGDDEDEEEDEELEDDELERRKEQIVALAGVSFRALSGTCVAVCGPAESGKSVLMRIVAGLVPPTRGRVVVHGQPAPIVDALLSAFPPWGSFGAALPVVAGLVRMPVRRVRRNLGEIFELVGEPGLRKERVNAIGGATRRRALLATMLSLDPDVLLIDTDLSGKAFSEELRRRMLELKASGGVIVIAARDPAEVAWIADRVVTLESGRVARDESLDEALARREAQVAEAPAAGVGS